MHSVDHEERCLLYDSKELSPAEAAAFEAELARCAECRDFLKGLVEARALCGAAAAGPRPGLDARVMAGFPAPAAPEPALRPGLPARLTAGLGMALAFAAVLAVFVVRRGGGDKTDLEWTGGLDGGIAAVSQELESVAASVGAEEEADIDGELDSLQRGVEQLGEQSL